MCHGCTFIFGNESTTTRLLGYSWRYNAKNLDRRCGGGRLIVKAVATFEPTSLLRKNENLRIGIDSTTAAAIQSSSDDDSTDADVDEKEHLRRMRISKANSGKRPWNKGLKHSAETLERIRERTRLAMQNPKVKMKLQNLGHAQSEETRLKIGDGVRMRWQRRREKQKLQETCCFEWENLVAEASRKGFYGEEELQWNSYEILDEQLEQEWRDSVKQRKNTPVASGSKRAPKSPEQRRKIAEAIAAKWADPGYRDRVHSGLSRYHGIKVGVEKPRRKAPSDKQPKKSPIKKAKPAASVINSQKQRPKSRRSQGPTYKDPLASSKLDMLISIRAQRAVTESTKSEAITRAKLLIAEAEKAAEALEIAATVSPLAQASLIETRKLIAEAIEYIGSIDTKYLHSHKTSKSPSFTSSEPVNHVENEPDLELEGPTETSRVEINGFRATESSDREFMDFGLSKINLQDLHDFNDDDDLQTSFYDPGFVNGKAQLHLSGSSDFEFPKLELEHTINYTSFTKQVGDSGPNETDQSESMLPDKVESQQVGNVEPNGIDQRETMLLPYRAISEAEKEEMQHNRPKKTKKWVRGKLVELEEE